MCDCTNQELIKELKDRGMVVAVRADVERAHNMMQLVKKFATGESKEGVVALAATIEVIDALDSILKKGN